MKHSKKIGFIIAIGITLYAGYSYTLTVGQRRQKVAQVEAIIAQPPISEQNEKIARGIISELKKGESARSGRELEEKLNVRLAQEPAKKAVKELSTEKERATDLVKQLEGKNKAIEEKNKAIEEKDRTIGELTQALASGTKKEAVEALNRETASLQTQLTQCNNEQFQIKAILGQNNFDKAKQGQTIDLMAITGISAQPIDELKNAKANIATLLGAIPAGNIGEALPAIEAMKVAQKDDAVKKLTDQVTALTQEKTNLTEQLKVAQATIQDNEKLLSTLEEKTKAGCKEIERMTKINYDQIDLVIGQQNFDTITKEIADPIIQGKKPGSKYNITNALRLRLLPEDSDASKEYKELTRIKKLYEPLVVHYDTVLQELAALKAQCKAVQRPEAFVRVTQVAVGDKNFEEIIKVAQALADQHGSNLPENLTVTLRESGGERDIGPLQALDLKNLPKESEANKEYQKLIAGNVFTNEGNFKGYIDQNITGYIGTQGIVQIKKMMQGPTKQIGNIENQLKLAGLSQNSEAHRDYQELLKYKGVAATIEALNDTLETILGPNNTERVFTANNYNVGAKMMPSAATQSQFKLNANIAIKLEGLPNSTQAKKDYDKLVEECKECKKSTEKAPEEKMEAPKSGELREQSQASQREIAELKEKLTGEEKKYKELQETTASNQSQLQNVRQELEQEKELKQKAQQDLTSERELKSKLEADQKEELEIEKRATQKAIEERKVATGQHEELDKRFSTLQERLEELKKTQVALVVQKRLNRLTMAINAFAKAENYANDYQQYFLIPALRDLPWQPTYAAKITAGQKRPESPIGKADNWPWFYPEVALPFPNVK